MKLVRYTSNGATRIGKVVDGGVVDLSGVTGPGASMKSVLERWGKAASPPLEKTAATGIAMAFFITISSIHSPACPLKLTCCG